MKWRHFIVLAAAFGLTAMGSPSNAAPDQMVPKGLGKRIVIPQLLSYQPPQLWKVEETEGEPQARGPVSNGVVPDITFNPGNYGSLTSLGQTFELTYYDNSSVPLKQVDQASFVTSAGVKGVRIHAVDTTTTPQITQYSYIFLSSDGQELELACACATVDAAVYLPVFDASMKTVVIAKGD